MSHANSRYILHNDIMYSQQKLWPMNGAVQLNNTIVLIANNIWKNVNMYK